LNRANALARRGSFHAALEQVHLAIKAALLRRFPLTYRLLSECLESADPEDIVYPNNPDEYSDVVWEALAQLAWHGNSLVTLTLADLERVLRTSLSRCFPDVYLDDEDEAEKRERRTLVLIELVDRRRLDLPRSC